MALITFNETGRIARTNGSATIGARLLTTLARWRQRSRDRAELARLTPRDARDLGLDPGVINYEASKPFWRA